MPHQAAIMQDNAKRVGVFGGYGSGKTYSTYKDDQKHILITPKGETLVGADTLVQLENTIRKDFERDMPVEFLRSYNRQKNLITFENGHILYWRHLAEVGDIRSYNLSRGHFLEASEIKQEAYVQIQTRLRNEAAIIHYKNPDGTPQIYYDNKDKQYKKKEKYNHIKFIAESNPDSNWIKDDILLKSGKIYIHHQENESNIQKYNVHPDEVIHFMSSHIIPTKANIHLPADFYESMAKDKPRWWIKRFLQGSFEHSEGLVYPNWSTNIVPDFDIPSHWKRVIGFDYGLSDNSHFVFGAIDPKESTLYFYRELVLSDMSITELANHYKQEVRIHVPTNQLFTTPRMDPKSYSIRTRTHDKKTIGTLFQEQGCFFRPGEIELNYRIMHLNDLIDRKKVFFFEEGFKHANKEGTQYKFPEKSLEKKTRKDDKPIDARNHGINAVEFITSAVNRNLQAPDQQVYKVEYDPLRRKPRFKDTWDPLSESPYTTTSTSTEGPASLFWEGD